MTSDSPMRAALAAAVAQKRAACAARAAELSPAEAEAFEKTWRARAERAARAKAARTEQRRTRRARDDNPGPTPSRLWAKAVSCDAARDRRLTMGARTALLIIRALTAKGSRISRNGLAVALGVCVRTIQRYLAELRKHGYIRTRLICNRIGWVIAQAIEITERVLPHHFRPRLAASLADGLARCLGVSESRRTPGATVLSSSQSRVFPDPDWTRSGVTS
ncbi:helix-turn-helix domain-containing protein [Magnetospirillum fulvum]|uniref:Helix-turn-helix type 11 domain-containing protein n=1 Tax=Magnetospirillum fulvum MGU-K5 TaxID=1316936 RepID=S9TEP7_MAGFU|nr:helix-turn-helix domain-containing protein [Magnetospirillum fulvum]EPY00701.1 hypothetical protein K678_14809 [Magnetospirillum fulvum MGU-K5]